MKIIFSFFALITITLSQDLILSMQGKYKMLSNIHMVNGISYKQNDYHALIEIPAGTTEKWEVNHQSGNIEWEFKNNKPRNIQFLGYPGNYGFVPQTILNKDEGGDGDPLDVLVLGRSVKRGSIQNIKILGAIKLLDEGEHDDKIIAVTTNGPFSKINNIQDMIMEFPGSIQIIRLWFEGYDKGSMQFMGYTKRKDAEALIEKAHKSWSKYYNAH